jgi:hypothetical protein
MKMQHKRFTWKEHKRENHLGLITVYILLKKSRKNHEVKIANIISISIIKIIQREHGDQGTIPGEWLMCCCLPFYWNERSQESWSVGLPLFSDWKDSTIESINSHCKHYLWIKYLNREFQFFGFCITEFANILSNGCVYSSWYTYYIWHSTMIW